MQPSTTHPEKPLRTDRTRRSVTIFTLLVVVFLYWVGLYLYVPTLPLYIQEKTSDLALVGLTLSMYGFWQMVSRLPIGILSDWAGRRKAFIFGCLLLVALGDWLLGSAANIRSAVLGRALVGLAAASWVPMSVLFGSLFEADETIHAMAILSMVGAFSRIVATSLNGWLNNLGGFTLAFQLAALASLLGAVIILIVPDQARRPQRPNLRGIWRLGRRRSVLMPSILQALLHMGDFAATFTFIPILARLRGASDVAISLLLSLDMAFSILGNLASRSLAPRIGRRKVSYLSIAFIGLGVGGAAFAPDLPMVMICQLMVGVGFGLGYPLLMGMSIDQIDSSEQTTAMGFHQSIYSIGMFAGPWLSGLLAKALGIPVMFAAIGAFILVSGAVVARTFQERPSPQEALTVSGAGE